MTTNEHRSVTEARDRAALAIFGVLESITEDGDLRAAHLPDLSAAFFTMNEAVGKPASVPVDSKAEAEVERIRGEFDKFFGAVRMALHSPGAETPETLLAILNNRLESHKKEREQFGERLKQIQDVAQYGKHADAGCQVQRAVHHLRASRAIAEARANELRDELTKANEELKKLLAATPDLNLRQMWVELDGLLKYWRRGPSSYVDAAFGLELALGPVGRAAMAAAVAAPPPRTNEIGAMVG